MPAAAPSPSNYTGLAVVGVMLLSWGCGGGDSPEAQVRAVIETGEVAAEERDLSRSWTWSSPDYVDDQGRDRNELKHYVHGYLIANQSIRLPPVSTGSSSHTADMARVDLTLGSLGREATEDSSFDLAADVQRLSIELQLDDGEWKVTRARRDALEP
jgi:hypothetical protein